MKKINLFFPIAIVVLVFIFFRPIFFNGKLPIPSDTIVGLYHPFRDLYRLEFPRGIPFKNFLTTDPVRQQYPWRYLSINSEKTFQLPLWNPYNFAGTPLLANFQSASLYPLNIVFLVLPFNYGWTFLIILQSLLGCIFMYLYLRFLKLEKMAALLGGIVFSFSGSSIVWMQWNTVFHTILWLPLILLAKEHLLQRKSIVWIVILIFAEISAVFAGHLQILFYTLLVSNLYLVLRIWQLYKGKHFIVQFLREYKLFLIIGIMVFLFTAIQWMPTLQYILLSARDADLLYGKEGWFMPLQNLVQFIIPDFFGNPATLNYWGVWNYAEFIGYVSILPFIFSLYALIYRRDKNVIFFGIILIVSLLFATENFLARIPFILNIPFISTSQPTRLIIIADFAISILSALGLDLFLKTKKNIHIPILVLLGIFVGLWIVVLFKQFGITTDSLLVAKRNLILPTGVFIMSSILLFAYMFIKNQKIQKYVVILFIVIVVFDLFRFGGKFLPFVSQNYIFPSTKTIEFLQKNTGHYRIMAIDDRILPPNFSIMYKLQTVSGYDPLYLKRYGELIAASERGKPNISPPFGFNRIITPHNYESNIIDLLGVKYVLSLEDLNSKKLKKVFQEGETRVYENAKVMGRTFLIDGACRVGSKTEVIEFLFQEDLRKNAVVEDEDFISCGEQVWVKPTIPLSGTVRTIKYSENSVTIEVVSNKNALLILTDSFYPTWKAKMDGKPTKVHRTDYNFRGVSVAGGRHLVEFYTTLL